MRDRGKPSAPCPLASLHHSGHGAWAGRGSAGQRHRRRGCFVVGQSDPRGHCRTCRRAAQYEPLRRLPCRSPSKTTPGSPPRPSPSAHASRVDPRGSPLQPPSQRLHRHPGEQRRVRHFPGGRFPAGSLVASRGGQPDRALRPDQATKAGILGLTRGVAREGLPACNATCPGATLTPNAKQQLQQRIAASGQGGDDVMAEPLLFLCGRAARKMAGTPSSSMAAGWRTGMEANHGRPA